MEKLDNIRLSDSFINLTDETVHAYEKRSGQIWDFLPAEGVALPLQPAFRENDQPIIHYIMDEKAISKLTELGRPLDDIVKIRDKLHGRKGVEISYLVWAENEAIEVYLYKNAHEANFPHK